MLGVFHDMKTFIFEGFKHAIEYIIEAILEKKTEKTFLPRCLNNLKEELVHCFCFLFVYFFPFGGPRNYMQLKTQCLKYMIPSITFDIEHKEIRMI